MYHLPVGPIGTSPFLSRITAILGEIAHALSSFLTSAGLRGPPEQSSGIHCVNLVSARPATAQKAPRRRHRASEIDACGIFPVLQDQSRPQQEIETATSGGLNSAHWRLNLLQSGTRVTYTSQLVDFKRFSGREATRTLGEDIALGLPAVSRDVCRRPTIGAVSQEAKIMTVLLESG